MALRVVKAELEKTLTDQVALFAAGPYQVGLFKNDLTVGDLLAIGDITPADFGGYSGLEDLDDWDAPVWAAPRWVSNHTAVVWTADGTSTNTIHGYYAVDDTGALAWVEKRAGGGVVVGSFNGQTYTVFPQYTRRSEF